MYDNTIKDQFVELRAEGKSFGQISEQLGVPKPTLHRWADQRAEDILRLRRAEWEDVEASGRWRAEDLLIDLNDRIDTYEDHLRHFSTWHLSLRDTLALLRETRRERDRLRTLLMGAPRSCRQATRTENAAPSQALYKTERFHENGTTQSRSTNDLQRPPTPSFHFPAPENQPVTDLSPHQNDAGETDATPLASASQPPIIEPPSAAAAQPPITDSAITDPLNTPSLASVPPCPSGSTAPDGLPYNPALGSIVINPLECNAAVWRKSREAEAAHLAKCLNARD